MANPIPGALLREARQRARLSQVELARRAGLNQSVVSAYESGSRQPSLPTLTRLIAATGLDLDVRLRNRDPGLTRLGGPLGQRLRRHRKRAQEIARAHGLSNLRVFGSVARGEDTADSDIDLLVDVSTGVGLIGLARCQHDLQALLEAPVDLVPAGDIKPRIARAVHADAVVL